MNLFLRISIVLTILVLIGAGLACSGAPQTKVLDDTVPIIYVLPALRYSYVYAEGMVKVRRIINDFIKTKNTQIPITGQDYVEVKFVHITELPAFQRPLDVILEQFGIGAFITYYHEGQEKFGATSKDKIPISVINDDIDFLCRKLEVKEEPPAPYAKTTDLAKDRSKWLKEALSKDPHTKFQAVYNLAITGYFPEAADLFIQITCDKTNDETTRDYACMGLSNYSNHIPDLQKDAIHQKLKDILLDERINTPDEIIRLLIRYGEAVLIHETFGQDLDNHPLEVEILAALPKEIAIGRLWQIYIACTKSRKAVVYNRKSAVGRALVKMGDNRGIDILITLLPPENAPGAQYRHNIFEFLARVFGENYGYVSQNYSVELEEAVPKMLKWWQENKSFVAWVDSRNCFVLDQEAKDVGIPTEEYRRTHPWPFPKCRVK